MTRIKIGIRNACLIVLFLALFPLGFWLDVLALRFYEWMGWT